VGFKAFDAAHGTLIGIELMHRLKQGQLVVEEGAEDLTAADMFSSLAASSSYHHGLRPFHHLLSKICDTTAI
jgi:hypothetical protein